MAEKVADRYEVRQIGPNSLVLIYRMGPYMKVECNSSNGRTIVVNEISGSYIPHQFDEIFGVGEYKKFSKHVITHTQEKNTNNPHSVKHTMIGDYLPKLAKKDIKAELPKDKSDLIGKYFK